MSGKIIIAGLGPGGLDLLPMKTYRLLTNKEADIYLRTGVHPAAEELKAINVNFTTFDSFYEQYESFEEVYTSIVIKLFEAAGDKDIIYAVPGHPMIGETTVQSILAAAEQRNVAIEILPAPSFLEAIFNSLRLDPLVGVTVLDSCALPDTHNPTNHLVVSQVYDRFRASDLKLFLMEYYPEEHEVVIIRGAGTSSEKILKTNLYELDRQEVDHLTSIYIEPVKEYQGDSMHSLRDVVYTLRGENGCPWDKVQTHKTLKRYLIEEGYEVLEAIDTENVDKLKEELGDVLLQVVLHTTLAEETDSFTWKDVVDNVTEKMIRRHPHVFGEVVVETATEVLHNWEEIKREERGEISSVFADLPEGFPGLLRAFKVQERAARVGFDWPDIDGPKEKVYSELEELWASETTDEVEEELGDTLFAIVNVARFLKIEPETALQRTVDKFVHRFRYIESKSIELEKPLTDMTLEEMDKFWEEAKKWEKTTRFSENH